MKKISLLLILISFLNCSKNENSLEYEKSVMTEIITVIIDSMFIDLRPYPILPNTNSKDIEGIKSAFLNKYPKYDSKYIVALNEIIEPYDKNDLTYLIDFSKFNNNDKFEFKKLSTFPKENIWTEKEKYNFIGVFSFTRIKFDKNKQLGELFVEYRCGGFCGHSAIINLKKITRLWKIDKIDIQDIL